MDQLTNVQRRLTALKRRGLIARDGRRIWPTYAGRLAIKLDRVDEDHATNERNRRDG